MNDVSGTDQVSLSFVVKGPTRKRNMSNTTRRLHLYTRTQRLALFLYHRCLCAMDVINAMRITQAPLTFVLVLFLVFPFLASFFEERFFIGLVCDIVF